MIIYVGSIQGLFSFIPYWEPVGGVDFKNSYGWGHLGITTPEQQIIRWRDYLADPTLHMLKKVNPLWLEAG